MSDFTDEQLQDAIEADYLGGTTDAVMALLASSRPPAQADPAIDIRAQIADTGRRELVVRLPLPLYEELKARAEHEERSIAATIRVALRQYLDRASSLSVPQQGEVCHGGGTPHPFTPGIEDMESSAPDHRWCNVCGEARVVPEGRSDG